MSRVSVRPKGPAAFNRRKFSISSQRTVWVSDPDYSRIDYPIPWSLIRRSLLLPLDWTAVFVHFDLNGDLDGAPI